MTRDHGGGLDAAIAAYGGVRSDWIDLSTGINPHPYPIPSLPIECWTALPDTAAQERLIAAARRFWAVPDHLDIVAAPGASSLIAQIPRLAPAGTVHIPGPTYNEHAAAFELAGWAVSEVPDPAVQAQVFVHPNNPTGAFYDLNIGSAGLTVIDESFCDVVPQASHVAEASDTVLILKSFGKFWGLAGLRLGFVICGHNTAARLRDALGPWAVSGPAQEIGARALEDVEWADATRDRLSHDARTLDALMTDAGAHCVGGTDLFRLYDMENAQSIQAKLARSHIWSRVFPYSKRWLRLGLPPQSAWDRLRAAL